MKQNITAIVIAKNEAAMIANCVESLCWCDEVLVVDNGSEDETAKIAESLDCRVVSFETNKFDLLRNKALQYVKTDWVIYIDADERVTPRLAQEILVHIETGSAAAFQIYRQNILYGHLVTHGGWDNDSVTRVFKVNSFKKWQGAIHESPTFDGQIIDLHSPLVHLTHRNTAENLMKSAEWTPIEAELLAKSGLPPITFITILKKGLMEFFRRAVLKKGYKDGLVGLIEALVQGLNRIMVYVQVWEFQQQPTLPELYQKQEVEIANLWKKYNADLKKDKK